MYSIPKLISIDGRLLTEPNDHIDRGHLARRGAVADAHADKLTRRRHARKKRSGRYK